MFVFGGYEALRERKGLTSVDTVPTPLMLQGNFSELLDPANPYGVTPIIDPLTCSAPPSGAGCKAFPGNIIPVANMNPVSRKLLALYPDPNQPGLASNYLINPNNTTNNDQGTVKIDHNNGLEAEVLEGLREGEQVLLHPGDKIKDGVAIVSRKEQ